MKKFLWLVILFPILLLAQDPIESHDNETQFGMEGMVGSTTFGTTTYSQIRLMPEITFWKFGFGLDIDLLIDKNGNLRKEDWDEPKDMLHKVSYIRFAQQGEPFYARVGSFPSHTIAHGLLMQNYSNTLLYPTQRNIGAMVGFNLPLPLEPGVELFTSNVVKNQIIAARGLCKPLLFAEIPIFSNLKLGVTAVSDRNQYGKYEDKDNDKVPDILDMNSKVKNKPNDWDGDSILNANDLDIDGDGILDSPWVNQYVFAQYPALNDSTLAVLLDNDISAPIFYGDNRKVEIYSIDYDIPLIQTVVFKLGHYAEYAKIKDYGSGLIFPGFYSKFLVFDVNLELRKFEDKFIPGYFDHLYEEQRAFVVNNEIQTKDKILETVKASFGWYGGVQANIFNIIILKIAYQDMYGEDLVTGKSLWSRVSIDPKIVPKIKDASIGYSQNNMQHLAINTLQSPSATVDGRVSYTLSESAFLIGKYSERYIDANGDNKIKGTEETVRSMTFGVEFQF